MEYCWKREFPEQKYSRMTGTTKEYALDNNKETIVILRIHKQEIRFREFNAAGSSKAIEVN